MKTILLTNDDGVDSPGIRNLKKYLDSKYRVVIVAPETQKSTTSHSFTLHKPLYLKEHEKDVYSVDGFPADCVYVGANSILKNGLDLVVSGVNKGGNLGTDIYLSGTVAGARQAVMQGYSAMAFSVEIFDDKDVFWETAFKVIDEVLEKYFNNEFKTFLNVNIPNLEYKDLKGYKVCKLGEKEYFTQVDWRVDPRNRKYCWIGGYLKVPKGISGSDCDFVYSNFVSITPFKLDVTDYEAFDTVSKILNYEDC